MRHFLNKDSFRFARDSALLVNATALTGFLYLLVHPILGRTLSGLDYYSVVQLMSLLGVMAVPSTAARVAVSRYVAEFAHGNQVALWVTVVRRALRRIAYWGTAVLVGWCLASGLLTRWLEAPSVLSVVLLGVMAYICLFSPIVQGTLQGALRFGWFSAAALLAATLRITLAGVLTRFVPSVEMALTAVGISMLAGVLIGAWPLRRLVADPQLFADFDTRPIYRYFWPVLLGQGAVFVLSSADVILAGRLLDPAHLAAYGKVATLSRTVLFLSQPVALAMFPRAVTSRHLRVLVGPLAFAFLISLIGAVALTILPSLPMRLMYGVRDPAYDHLTCLYVWAVLPHAMAMFISQYLWARHRTGSVLCLIPVTVAYLAGLAVFHDTPEQIIAVLASAGWIALAVLAVGVTRTRRVEAPEIQGCMTAARDMRQVLVITLGGAGDGVMATPLLRQLHAELPDVAIDVLVMQGNAARDVFAGNPLVRECLLHNFMKEPAGKSLRFCLGMRRRHYDASFTVMPQNRLEYNAITFLIGARRRFGFDFAIPCGSLPRVFLTDRVPEDTQAHLVENNLRLLIEGLGLGAPTSMIPMELHLTPAHLQSADRAVQSLKLEGREIIGLHPGTGTTKNLALRRWDPDKWARLAQLLAESNDDRILMLFGGPDELELRAQIRRQAGLPDGRLLDAPGGSILDSAALLRKLSCLVCCDTLLTHLAAAVKTPQVLIMGPTPHTSVYPYGAPHRIVRLGLTCSPCYGYSRHGIRCTHPSLLACLKGIEPERVLGAVESMLAEGRRENQPEALATNT